MRFVAIALCMFLAGTASAYAEDGPAVIPKEWLQKPISVAEAEAANPGITDDRIERFPDAAKPFGFMNGEWEAMKAQMRPGDALWTFSSSSDSWQHYAGRSGIALVRNGTPIKTLVGRMN
jgi:hypothetical protein